LVGENGNMRFLILERKEIIKEKGKSGKEY
jgi:hypothetical protein